PLWPPAPRRARVGPTHAALPTPARSSVRRLPIARRERGSLLRPSGASLPRRTDQGAAIEVWSVAITPCRLVPVGENTRWAFYRPSVAVDRTRWPPGPPTTREA